MDLLSLVTSTGSLFRTVTRSYYSVATISLNTNDPVSIKCYINGNYSDKVTYTIYSVLNVLWT
jgi:hypothetical protein